MTCEKEILVYILPDIFVAEVSNLYKPTKKVNTFGLSVCYIFIIFDGFLLNEQAYCFHIHPG